MTQSPFLGNNDNDELPPQVSMKRSISVQLIKIDCDCSRGRGNFDEGNENDYDNLPKDDRKRDDKPKNRQQRVRPPILNSISMEQIDRFRYTPGESDEQTQPSNFSPKPSLSPSSSGSSPKKTSSFQNNNNKQTGQNDNRSVTFGGRVVEDHKSGQSRRRGQNQDYGNYNRNGGNKNRHRGITRSSSLVIGSKYQVPSNQNQPSTPQPQQQQTNHPNPPVPLPPQNNNNNIKVSASQANQPVLEWKPKK